MSFFSDFICFAENQKSKSSDQGMLHSSGQIKACMTSKQYTFENNVYINFHVGRFSRREIKFHGD